jgi:hypothetical protein
MGTILVKSALNALKMKFSKNVNNKKCATKLNFFNEKLNEIFLKHLKHFLLKLCPLFVS